MSSLGSLAPLDGRVARIEYDESVVEQCRRRHTLAGGRIELAWRMMLCTLAHLVEAEEAGLVERRNPNIGRI
jgi:hypothetical protein